MVEADQRSVGPLLRLYQFYRCYQDDTAGHVIRS